jgi:recombination protein RecT
MAKVNDVKNAVAKTGQPMGIQELIQKSAAELGKALPAHMRPERIVRIALTTLRMNPRLYECNPQSFLAALFQSAQLGLEPNIEGQAYIIPYGQNAQFQIGYKGYVELFFRHQSSLSLDMQEVCENDTFDWQYGTESYIKHRPALSNRGKVVAYYAVAKLKDGASLFKVMSREDCMEHGKKHSKAFSKPDSPWQKDPDAMCKKTVLIQLMKLLPKSIEIQRALAMDETVKTEIKADMFEVSDKTDWSEDPKVAVSAAVTESGSSEAEPLLLSDEQHKKIEAMIAEAVKNGADKQLRDKAHKWMDVDSFSHLTKDQASQLIEQLQITLNEVKGEKGGK